MARRRVSRASSAGPHIVGVDEAGRGALAGPVVAGACILSVKPPRGILIADSKQLSPAQRETAYAWICKHCIWGVGVVSASDIDAIGILAATERAMQQAVACVATQEASLYVLVDGRDAFWFDFPHSSIVRGDQTESCIAAASILAKVTRDRMMLEMDVVFPGYGFARHKGYGTPAHFAAIQKNRRCDEHRRTFLSERG